MHKETDGQTDTLTDGRAYVQIGLHKNRQTDGETGRHINRWTGEYIEKLTEIPKVRQMHDQSPV